MTTIIDSPRHVLAWSEPPRGDSSPVAMLAELKANPGRWGLVRIGPSHHVTTWKARGCEAESKRINGQVYTWARWPLAPGAADAMLATAAGLGRQVEDTRRRAYEAGMREEGNPAVAWNGPAEARPTRVGA